MLETRSDRRTPQASGSDMRIAGSRQRTLGSVMVSQDSMQTSAGSIATVGALFRSCAALHGDSVALEYRGRRISYAELLERVLRATAMLAAQGLQRGDRV